VDNWYGILALAILTVGYLRRERLAYDQAHGFFWAKIAAFIAVALLSVIPTIQITRWREN
jgi:uncharacterized membrane protein